MKCRSVGIIKEGNENARLFGEETDELWWANVDKVKKLVEGRSSRKVSNKDWCA